jgi:hypothetical protein
MPEYRVPVVVFATVDGVDYRDAVNIAERAVSYAVYASEREAGGSPVIGFVSRGRTFEALVDAVMSIDRALWATDSRLPGLDIVDVRGREVSDP